jgi:hypothetical protein
MQRIQESRDLLLAESCDWVLRYPDFVDWRSSETTRLLWIKGGSGKGKTMLLMGIIKELSQSLSDANILSFFFCQATDANLRSAAAVLRGLVHQILVQNRALISYLRDQYDSAGSKLFEGNDSFTSLSSIIQDDERPPNKSDIFDC